MRRMPETKTCYGGPFDGQDIETPDTELAAIELPSGNLALYKDVGTRMVFDQIIPAKDLIDDEAALPPIQEPEL
jgi:hypothetical protein